MNYAIILAGGKGMRVGSNTPKQYIEVLKKPIIAYTIEKFQNSPSIDKIIVVSHKNWISFNKSLIKKYRFSKVINVIEGGDSFPESTVKGLFSLQGTASNNDIVLVHGSCSPLVTEEVINDCIKVAEKHKTAMASQDIYFSTCIKDNRTYSTKAIDKENLTLVQFPLGFKYGYISKIYKECINNNTFNSLGLHLQYAVFNNGGKMYYSKGNQRNIKITTKEDIELFEGYLLYQKKHKGDMK